MNGVLKLKLGASRVGPTKRLAADLHAVALLCNVARNAMVRAWLRWREDHPDFQDAVWPARVTKDGNDPGEFTRQEDGSWARADGKAGQSFRNVLYHAARKVAPTLSPALISSIAGEVESHLKGKMPYNHTGKSRKRWQAILTYEAGVTTFRNLAVPVPNNNAALCYTGLTTRAMPRAVAERLHRYGDSGCTLAFPLFSDTAGRRWKAAVASVLVSRLPDGLKHILRRVCLGAWRFADSELVFDGKAWYFHLTYGQPDDAVPETNKGVVATLAVVDDGEADSPFAVSAGDKSWKVGHGRLLVHQFRRLEQRRRAMRTDYGTAGGGRRGHGRARNERDIRPVTRMVGNVTRGTAKAAAAEVVRFCQRYGCGTVAWELPALARRDRLWFKKNDVQWDWTFFDSVLRNQCMRAGIAVAEPNQAPVSEPRRNGTATSGSMNGHAATSGRGGGKKPRGARR